MQLLRLRGRKICDRVLRQGLLWKGKHLHIRWLQGPPRHPSVRLEVKALYMGTVASAKLDKSAVNRNRMRRRCREALRLFLKDSDASLAAWGSMQLLIMPRSSSLKAPFAELQSDVRAFLTTQRHGPAKAQ